MLAAQDTASEKSPESRQVRMVAEETIQEAAWQDRWVLDVAELAAQDAASEKFPGRRQVWIVAEETILEAAWQDRWVLAVAELAAQDTASQKFLERREVRMVLRRLCKRLDGRSGGSWTRQSSLRRTQPPRSALNKR